MIRSFGNRTAEALFHGLMLKEVRAFPPELRRKAERKLDLGNNAHRLDDLRLPSGNRLEALCGEFVGAYSIRVNDQWRVVFRWDGTDAHEVSVVDYH